MTSFIRLTIVLLCLTPLLVPGLGRAAGADEPQPLASALEDVITEWAVPGMAVTVVKDGIVVFAQGFGTRRIGSDLPVTPQTRFSIGSCTKAFTAAALATLVDQDRVAWDDPVVRHLNGFEMPDPSDTGHVTLRDLLAHRTGLFGGDLISWGSTFSRQELVERIRYLEQIAPLRTQFQYNNNVFAAAGEVASAVSGISWDEVVLTHLVEPLGMAATTTTIGAIPPEVDRASPHAIVGGSLQPIPPINEDNIAAAGSIWSTAEDMGRWMLMLLGEGTLGDQKILPEAVIADLWRLEMPIPLDEEWALWPVAARPHFSGYGLGWFLYDSRGRKIITHEGMSDGMVAGVTLVPEEELGIVVLANRHDCNVVRPVLLMLLDHFAGVDELTDWSRLYLDLEADEGSSTAPPDGAGAQTRTTRQSLDLEHYTGTYSNPAIGTATLTLVEGRLRIDFTNSPLYSAILKHADADVFIAHRAYPLVDPSPITFAVDTKTAEVTAFTLHPDTTEWLAGIAYRFERIPEGSP